jgi:hypothetical protein
MTNDLRDKAIKIQGKDYVLVADRIIFFNEYFPNGSIKTELISEPTSEQIIIKATVTPDAEKPERIFTGYSQAVVGQGYINKTSALENAETSAVGRALAMLGIGVIESVASADEIHKATGSQTFSGQWRENSWSDYDTDRFSDARCDQVGLSDQGQSYGAPF